MLKKIVFLFVIVLYGWSQTINISNGGWVLEGVVSDINNSSVFDKACVDVVWKYDNGVWKGYSSKVEIVSLLQKAGTYDANFTLKQGRGFWINATSPCTIDTTNKIDFENPSDDFIGKKIGVYAGYFWEFYDDNLLLMTRDLYPNVPLQTAKYTVINSNEINITWDNNRITDNVVFNNGLKVDGNFTISGSDITNGATTFTIPEIADINASNFGFTKEMICGEGDYCLKTFYIVEEHPDEMSYLDSMEISATDLVYTEFPPGCTETTCAQDYSGTYDYNITNAQLDIHFPKIDTVEFGPYVLLQVNDNGYNKYGYYNVQTTIGSEIVNMRFYKDKDEAIKYLNELNGD